MPIAFDDDFKEGHPLAEAMTVHPFLMYELREFACIRLGISAEQHGWSIQDEFSVIVLPTANFSVSQRRLLTVAFLGRFCTGIIRPIFLGGPVLDLKC